MGVECVTLRMSLRRGRYVGHLQWDSMRKLPTVWENLYVYGVLVLGDTIYSRDGDGFTETACPTRGPWFGKFMQGSKLLMGLIKKQYFGVTIEIVKSLFEVWDVLYRREGLTRRRDISSLDSAMVVGFCGGLRVQEVFLASLNGILPFWQETIKKKYCSRIMVTLKGWFKGETGLKWHMLPLVDITELVIEVGNWVGIWLDVLVEKYGRLEGWIFQRK